MQLADSVVPTIPSWDPLEFNQVFNAPILAGAILVSSFYVINFFMDSFQDPTQVHRYTGKQCNLYRCSVVVKQA